MKVNFDIYGGDIIFENVSIAITNVIAGILFILMSIPLYREKVEMNYFYGVRFKKSFESEENWYKINKYGAKRLILWSIPLLVCGVFVLFLPPLNEPIKLIFICAPLIILIPVIESYIYSKKI